MTTVRTSRRVAFLGAIVALAAIVHPLPASADRTPGFTSTPTTRVPPPPPPPSSSTRLAVARDLPPVTGFGLPELEPVANALQDYVAERCAGAVTVGVSYQGTVIAEWGVGREHGRATNMVDPACGTDLTDPYDPTSANADQYTPMRIGSISKTMSAATLRWALKEKYLELTGETITDDELEAMPLLGDDFPGGLIPEELRATLAGETPLPAAAVQCDALGGYADERWQTVTLGHLLAHRAGLERSAPSYEGYVIPSLPELRGLDSEADFDAQNTAVRDGVDDPSALDAARTALDGGSSDAVYFVDPPTAVEYAQVVAGRCLEFEVDGTTYTVGDYSYSNTDPLFWTVIMEHATGVPFNASAGDPASHQGSLLQQFFEDQLGLNSFSDVGVFRQPATVDPDEPVVTSARHWNADQATLSPLQADDKRPHCRWDGASCSFDEWGDGTRADWNFDVQGVPFERSGVGLSGATGGLMITPRFMLSFMNEFRVGGYGSNPTIGQPRTAWTDSASHTGEMSGARAVAASYSGNYDAGYNVPPIGADGRITDDLDHLEHGEFRPPAGLDVFVAVNQSTDPKCQASAALNDTTEGDGTGVLLKTAPHYTCDTAYGALDDYALYGLAQVDWDALTAAIDADPPAPVVPLGPGGVSG